MNVRKTYLKPTLECHKIDRDIILVAMSINDGRDPGTTPETPRSSSNGTRGDQSIAPKNIAVSPYSENVVVENPF